MYWLLWEDILDGVMATCEEWEIVEVGHESVGTYTQGHCSILLNGSPCKRQFERRGSCIACSLHNAKLVREEDNNIFQLSCDDDALRR